MGYPGDPIAAPLRGLGIRGVSSGGTGAAAVRSACSYCGSVFTPDRKRRCVGCGAPETAARARRPPLARPVRTHVDPDGAEWIEMEAVYE